MMLYLNDLDCLGSRSMIASQVVGKRCASTVAQLFPFALCVEWLEQRVQQLVIGRTYVDRTSRICGKRPKAAIQLRRGEEDTRVMEFVIV